VLFGDLDLVSILRMTKANASIPVLRHDHLQLVIKLGFNTVHAVVRPIELLINTFLRLRDLIVCASDALPLDQLIELMDGLEDVPRQEAMLTLFFGAD